VSRWIILALVVPWVWVQGVAAQGAAAQGAAATVGAAATSASDAGAVLVYRHVGAVENVDGPEAASGVETGEQVSVQRFGLRLEVEADRALISFPVTDPVAGQGELLPWRLLYLGERRALVLLNDAEQTFTEVDPEILVVLEKHLDRQDTDRRIQLLQLPEVPRRLMADVLAKEEAARARRLKWSPWEVLSTGTWAEQQGHRSLAYRVLADGEPFGELWVAEVGNTSFGDANLLTLRQASLLIDQVLFTISQMTTADSLTLLGFESNPLAAFAFQRGLPVVLRRIADGTVKYEKILESIEPRQHDDGSLGIPHGYRRGILGLH
jgi:hypothetical protein